MEKTITKLNRENSYLLLIRVKFFIFISITSLFVLSCEEENNEDDDNIIEPSASFVGTWEGNVGGNDFRFIINSNTTSTGENISDSCIADMIIVSSTDSELVMEVDLSSGSCINDAIIVLELINADEVNFQFFAPDVNYKTSTPIIEGSLFRV